MTSPTKKPSRIFISYAHEDEELRNRLEVHLAVLKRQGFVKVWHDRKIAPGDDIDEEINAELNRADIILLLVSPDFIASEYCYGIEVKRALERHKERTARLIPVILRPCSWRRTGFGKYAAIPTDGQAVTRWEDRDEAFLNIEEFICKVIETTEEAETPNQTVKEVEQSDARKPSPESTIQDERVFLADAFDYIADFFQKSLEDLKSRHPGVQTRFRKASGDSFTAFIQRRDGKSVDYTIALGWMHSPGITCTHTQNAVLGMIDECLVREREGKQSFLVAKFSPTFEDADGGRKMNYEEAAKYLLSKLTRLPEQEKK